MAMMAQKIALVTGGSGGIGTAICQNLHDRQIKVIAGFSHQGDNSYVLNWLEQQKQKNYDFDLVYGDVTDFAACARMIEEVHSKFGAIDILINNAGITRDVTFKKMTLEEWNAVMRVNLDGLFNVTKHVINSMIQRQYGRIINISSINGQKGQFGQTNYSATKAGVHGFTKALAQEVANKGITVNTVSPGYVATEMVENMPSHVLEQIIAQIPVGRLAKPSEIGRVVAFLAAPESGFITGANIAINGGQHMC